MNEEQDGADIRSMEALLEIALDLYANTPSYPYAFTVSEIRRFNPAWTYDALHNALRFGMDVGLIFPHEEHGNRVGLMMSDRLWEALVQYEHTLLNDHAFDLFYLVYGIVRIEEEGSE